MTLHLKMPARETAPAPIWVNSQAVADILGFTSSTAFLAQRKRLEEEEDFPPPSALSRGPKKWRRSAVIAWADRQCLTDFDNNPVPDLPHGLRQVGGL